MLPLFVFYGIVFIMFIAMGIVFSCGKGAFLIAGYNTSSAEEKSRIDEKLLCKFMGKLFFSLAGCWLIVVLGGGLNITFLFVTGLLLFIMLLIGAAVYANNGSRFKK